MYISTCIYIFFWLAFTASSPNSPPSRLRKAINDTHLLNIRPSIVTFSVETKWAEKVSWVASTLRGRGRNSHSIYL